MRVLRVDVYMPNRIKSCLLLYHAFTDLTCRIFTTCFSASLLCQQEMVWNHQCWCLVLRLIVPRKKCSLLEISNHAIYALRIDVGSVILIEGRHSCVFLIQILEKFPSVPNTWFLVGKACTVLLHGS